jgi:DNA-binding NarL/FixJ family response regulator
MQSIAGLLDVGWRSDLSSDELVQRLRDRQLEAAQKIQCLTPRECQVLQMVTGGFPNKVIASELNLSIKTIEKHRGSIMRKLRLRSVCELVQLWVTLTWDSILDMRSGWSHSQSTSE